MSQVIEFIERLGQDAHLRHASTDAVAQALLEAGIEEPLRTAILGDDRWKLEALLGSRSKMYCGIFAPDEEEKKVPVKEDEEQEDETEEESEDDKENE